MKNTRMKYCGILILSLLLLVLNVNAQKQKLPTTFIDVVVVDDAGNTLNNMQLISTSVQSIGITDQSGNAKITSAINDNILIMKENFTTVSFPVLQGKLQSDTLVIFRNTSISEDKAIQTPLGEIDFGSVAGNAIVISGEDISRFSGNNLLEALRGKVPGLRIKGDNMNGRGGKPLLLVDGYPVDYDNVNIQEIKEVVYLTDYQTIGSLGALAADGVLYVRTKTAEKGEKRFEVNYEHGLDVVSDATKFMDAPTYVNTINELAIQDGLPAIFDAGLSGSDPIFYPALNLQEELLNNIRNTDKVGALFSGAFTRGNYYFYGGLDSEQGLEAVGEQQRRNNMLFKSKVDIAVNDFISGKFGVTGRYGTFHRSTFSESELFNSIVNTAPNAFPLQLEDGTYIASQQFPINPLADMQEGGYMKDVYSNITFDAAVRFNFDKQVKGLSYSTNLMIDNKGMYTESLTNVEELYRIDGQDSTGMPVLNLLRKLSYQDSPNISNSDVSRTYIYSGTLNYNKAFQKHAFSAYLSHYLYFNELAGTDLDTRYLTNSAYVNYSYNKKYLLDLSMSYSGSQRFIESKRYNLSPSVGVAWVISNESFLRDNKQVNYLKIRSSYGTSSKVPSLEYLTQSVWETSYDRYYYGIDNQGISLSNQYYRGLRQIKTGNPDISWVKLSQFSVGADAMLFNNKLSAHLNYFYKLAEGYASNLSSKYSSTLGDFSAYLPMMNANTTAYRGIETALSFSEKLTTDFSYTIAANYTYYNTELVEDNSLIYADNYRNTKGLSNDLIWGMESAGLFPSEEEIQAYATQRFGSVNAGDIKYIDKNNDQVINEKDMTFIGNRTPRHSYGISVNLQYKKVYFSTSGYGLAGYDINLNGNKYYQINGFNNYPQNLSELPNSSTMPRISLIDNANNYINSDYWLVKGNMFRLNNVEIGYHLPYEVAKKIFCKQMKVFVRANNLFVISQISDLDPEYMQGGISEYPNMQTFILGITIRF